MEVEGRCTIHTAPSHSRQLPVDGKGGWREREVEGRCTIHRRQRDSEMKARYSGNLLCQNNSNQIGSNIFMHFFLNNN